MAQLMLINPAKRPSKRRKASAAQLRALAKGRASRAAKTNPSPRRRRRSTLRARARSHRSARRNPIGMTGIMGSLIGAAEGAGGALAVNAIFNLLPLPDAMKTGIGMTATKLGLAVALGTVGKKFLGRTAGKMAEGAMTVAAFEAIQSMVPATFGGSQAAVAGMGYMSPGLIAGGHGSNNMSLPFNTSESSSVGEYVSGMGQYTY